jgi:hypothetical protein
MVEGVSLMVGLGRVVFAGYVSLAALGCGQEGPSGSGGSARTVAWVLEVVSPTDFGARVWLDGEAIYSQTVPLVRGHRVEVEKPYRAGEHVVQFEILSASVDPSTYTAAWTVQVKPTGPSLTADGVPTALSVGERLTIRVQP